MKQLTPEEMKRAVKEAVGFTGGVDIEDGEEESVRTLVVCARMPNGVLVATHVVFSTRKKIKAAPDAH